MEISNTNSRNEMDSTRPNKAQQPLCKFCLRETK
jgi:hypothetical protein